MEWSLLLELLYVALNSYQVFEPSSFPPSPLPAEKQPHLPQSARLIALTVYCSGYSEAMMPSNPNPPEQAQRLPNGMHAAALGGPIVRKCLSLNPSFKSLPLLPVAAWQFVPVCHQPRAIKPVLSAVLSAGHRRRVSLKWSSRDTLSRLNPPHTGSQAALGPSCLSGPGACLGQQRRR